MYKVMIVDDESEIRTGIRLKIDWHRLGFTISGEAANGKEALELLAQHPCDVLITDIRMPTMNGLELIRQCVRLYPHLKFIVLSGYDDFSYAKLALQCGVKDYLLKPLIRAELNDILSKVYEELEHERETQLEQTTTHWQLTKLLPILQEQLMSHVIKGQLEAGMITTRAKQLQMTPFIADGLRVQFVCVEMRVPPGRLGLDENHDHLLTDAFRMMCHELALQDMERVFCFHDWQHPLMMHFIINIGHDDDPQLVTSLIKRMQETMRQLLRVETVIGIGQPVLAVDGLRQGYETSLLAWSQSTIGAESQVHRVATHDDTIILTPELERRLVLSIENMNTDEFKQLLSPLLDDEQPHSIRSYSLFAFRMMLLLDGIAKKYGIELLATHDLVLRRTDMMWGFESQHELMTYLVQISESLVAQIANARDPQLSMMETIRQYIDVNYAHDLSLSMLAERFYMNATYVSELFKKHVGQNFSSYLTEVRMLKAKELLLEPGLRLVDIAELVGYANASYFSSVFKKQFGISPQHYRTSQSSPAPKIL